MRKVKILGKTIPAIIIALVAMSTVGLAAVLAYYGVIVTTVDVHQSIKLLKLDGDRTLETDWLQCTPGYGACTIEHTQLPESSPGGEKFCFKHWLKNQMSVEGTVDFETLYSPDGEGIETHIVRPLGYKKEATSVTYNYYKPNGIVVAIKVEDGECFLKFTFDFPIDEDQGNGNMGYGLVISTDGIHPLFQVHNNDGTCSNWAWGTHLYSEYDDGWHTGGLSCADTNTPVSEKDWIEATGHRYKDGKEDDPTPNPDGIFTVTIDKCKLISLIPLEEQEHIYWAVHFGAGGFYDYGGLAKYPEAWAQWSGNAEGMEDAEIGEQLTGSLTIPSHTEQDFCLCYKFAQNIKPGTYTITTNIVPMV